MATPSFVAASTGGSDPGTGFTATCHAPGAADRLILLQIFGTSTARDSLTFVSATNIENQWGQSNAWTYLGAFPIGGSPDAYQHIFAGWSTGTSAPTFTGNSGTGATYWRFYEFADAWGSGSKRSTTALDATCLAYLDGLTIGSELVTNPGFETDTTGYYGVLGATITRITSDFHSGSACCDVNAYAPATDYAGIAGEWGSSLATRQRYRASCWVKAYSGSEVGHIITLLMIAQASGEEPDQLHPTLTADWQYIEMDQVFWNEAGVGGAVRADVRAYNPTLSRFLVDDFSIKALSPQNGVGDGTSLADTGVTTSDVQREVINLAGAGGVVTKAYYDPNGNGANTAWSGDYTSIDDGVRSPTNAQTGGDGNSISSGTVGALEDHAFGTGTYNAGSTWTFYIFGGSGNKRGLSVSFDGGSNWHTVFGGNAAVGWYTIDVSGYLTGQVALDNFSVRWRVDSTASSGGAGSVTVYAAYLEQGIPENPTVNAFSGQSGGTWVEAVSEYRPSGGPTLQMQRADMAAAGTINGGTATLAGTGPFPWGVVGFALIPDELPAGTFLPKIIYVADGN